MFNLTRGEELTALILVVLAGIAVGAVCLVRGDKPRRVEIPLNKWRDIKVQRAGEQSQQKIVVHISGEVQKKGVLELDAGSRLGDAIELANATDDADLESLNLAAPLVDGERIVVPGKGTVPITGRSSPWAKPAIRININNASQPQLETIPGIGPVLAGRIIQFRETRQFDSVDELLQIKGIGPVTLEKIRGYVRVN
jgi:competence protein ComEA